MPFKVCTRDRIAPNRLFPDACGTRPACSPGENPILVNLLALLTSRFPREGGGPERGAVDTLTRERPSSVSVSGQSRELIRLSCPPWSGSRTGVLERLVARAYIELGSCSCCGGVGDEWTEKDSSSSEESGSCLTNILPELPMPDADRVDWWDRPVESLENEVLFCLGDTGSEYKSTPINKPKKKPTYILRQLKAFGDRSS